MKIKKCEFRRIYINCIVKLCRKPNHTIKIITNLIVKDDSVRLLIHLLKVSDYTKLYRAYSFVGIKQALEPKIMFKILSYAYSQNIYSSRKMEKECNRDINFKWLFQGYKEPGHATIRNSYSKADHDATFIHIKDHHMRNGQLKPEYNVQIAVESEYVTGVGIFDDRND